MSLSVLETLTRNVPAAELHYLWQRLSYFDYALLAGVFLAATKSLGDGRLWNKPDPYYYKLFERPQLLCGETAQPRSTTRNIGKLLEEKSSDIVIFWASQSGTAEGFAWRLAKDFKNRLGLKISVVDLDEFDHETLSELPASKLAFFIVSTYGEGEPCDNGVGFLKWIQSTSLPLKSIRYSAFGLGNSNYRLYNKAVIDIVEALEHRGASQFSAIGKGDEAQRSTEEDFAEWKEQIMATVATHLNLPEKEPEYRPTISIDEVEELSQQSNVTREPFLGQLIPRIGTSPVIEGKVTSNDILTTYEDACRQSVHVEIDISMNPKIKYKTGDHLMLWPVNPAEEISNLLAVIGLQQRRHTMLRISKLDNESDGLNLPSETTIEDLFRCHLEICGPVSRESVLYLSQYASTPSVAIFLKKLAQDKASFASFTAQKHVTLSRLLEYTKCIDSFVDWSHLPLSLVVEIVPPITPRYYSISSSSIVSPRRISITVAVKPTPLSLDPSIMIPGLASTHLSLCKPTASDLPSTTIQFQIRSSSFKLPASSSTPIIMIGAGTGIAPFRAFVQQRSRIASNTKNSVGQMLLFFGCQNSETDFLYRDEMLALQQREDLRDKFEIITAFSRPGISERGVYVQHRVAEQSIDLARLLLDQDAALYICGSVTMAKAVGEEVKRAILKLKSTQNNNEDSKWDEVAFAKWRNERKRARRWCEDVWG